MCELGSDLVRPAQPLFSEPRLLLIPSALAIRYSYPHLPSSYLTPLESHPCTKREGNSNGITSLRKNGGGGGLPLGARESRRRERGAHKVIRSFRALPHTDYAPTTRMCRMYAKPFRLSSYANSAAKLFRMRSYKIIGLKR